MKTIPNNTLEFGTVQEVVQVQPMKRLDNVQGEWFRLTYQSHSIPTGPDPDKYYFYIDHESEMPQLLILQSRISDWVPLTKDAINEKCVQAKIVRMLDDYNSSV